MYREGGFVALVVDFSPSRLRVGITFLPSRDVIALPVRVQTLFLGLNCKSGGWFCIGRVILHREGRKNFLPYEGECRKEMMSLCGVVAKEET